jgi:hypothetical protein
MVVEVLPDARHVGDDVDPVRAQMVSRANARQHQQVRRADRACADEHLRRVLSLQPSPRAEERYALTASALEQQPVRTSVQDDAQCAVARDRAKVRSGRTLADAVLDAVLHEGHAVLNLTVVVPIRRNPALKRGVCDRPVDGIGDVVAVQVHDPAIARNTVLDPLEHRSHEVPAPSLGT